MRIAIAGGGIAGAYLYRILSGRGYEVDIFDKRNNTKCGLTPCAWGTSRGFNELVSKAGLEPTNYLLVPSKNVFMDDIRVRADLWTFDKKRLVDDLLRGTTPDYSQLDVSRYDRLIDATGVARAFLPKIEDDLTLPCVQFRVTASEPPENRIRLGRIGYAWSFPLSTKEYHLGCGSLRSDPLKVLRDIGWADGEGRNGRDVVCTCRGRIRLTGPKRSLPFVIEDDKVQIWGAGEAIGCVAPLAGDGVVPGLKSAQLLLEWWNDPAGYTRAVLREFGWMEDERQVLDKLIANKRLGPKDAWVLRENSTRMGMEVGLKEALLLLHQLR